MFLPQTPSPPAKAQDWHFLWSGDSAWDPPGLCTTLTSEPPQGLHQPWDPAHRPHLHGHHLRRLQLHVLDSGGAVEVSPLQWAHLEPCPPSLGRVRSSYLRRVSLISCGRDTHCVSTHPPGEGHEMQPGRLTPLPHWDISAETPNCISHKPVVLISLPGPTRPPFRTSASCSFSSSIHSSLRAAPSHLLAACLALPLYRP